jgi:hypothetical protein
MPPSVQNKGRTINFISGLNGVAAGGQAILNIPCIGRYHRIILSCFSAGVAASVASIISSIKLIVNGVTIRDIDPANILKVLNAQGYIPLLGELPLHFTEPLLTGGVINEPDDMTSWDMVGQQTFQLQIGIQAGAVTPSITGIWEFDYQRNLLPDGNPFLQVVNQHQFTTPVPVGRYDWTTLPFTFPLRRMYFYGSTPGNISQLEIYQDGNKVLEATQAMLNQAYRSYRFKFNNTPDATSYVNATGPANLGVSALLETPAYFEAMYLADEDTRIYKALRIGGNLTVRITSAVAQNITVIQENVVPGYLG